MHSSERGEQYDRCGQGSIDTSELRDALERMGMGLSEKQLVDIIAAIDKDQDLELSYKELLAAVSPATVGLSLLPRL